MSKTYEMGTERSTGIRPCSSPFMAIFGCLHALVDAALLFAPCLAVALCFAGGSAAGQSPLVVTAAQTQSPSHSASGKEKPRISPGQARKLFSLVDQLIAFSSQETGLPIKSTVKRQLTNRTAIEGYLKEKFNDDESAKRFQRSEIVLKKFGLLDRDFDLKPFLLELLKEQIEAYYDSKTKTVYMLDWVDIEEQKPVLAHELTHALQDQHSDLEKWGDQTPENVSLDAACDAGHLAKDEMNIARDAVAEGQATAVMMDYVLKPLGKSLAKNPEVMGLVNQRMSDSDNTTLLARAPLLLSESLLFPYRAGLNFEQIVWVDQGQAAAFTGALDRPPTSTWGILNPREYEHQHVPAVPLLPNIHPLVDPFYKPYDIGQIGQLDLHILAGVIGGSAQARVLTPAWDGGIYWAGQRLNAKTPKDQASTNSIALFYLSAWKDAASARSFARLYADNLGHKYSGLKVDRRPGFAVFPPPVSSAEEFPDPASSVPVPLNQEQVYTTSEGPVLITTRGKLVFIAESFDLVLARKLATLVLDAQGTGELHRAKVTTPNALAPSFEAASGSETMQPLTASLTRFFSNCGVMKAAVEAAVQTGK